MGSEEGDELLTVHEAAQQLGVVDTAVRNAINRGRLPHQVKYGRILIKPADVAAYKERARRGRPKKQPPEGESR